MTSYHLDPDNSQSEQIKVFVNGAIAPVVGDASFPGGDSGAPGVGGLTTSIVQSKAITFGFLSNGVDPVLIQYDGSTASDAEVPLNAIDLVAGSAPRFSASIDLGPNSQRIEPGFAGLGTAATNSNGVVLAATEVLSLSGDVFTVETTGVDWRDRGDSSSADALARLGEDFVKSNAGNITVTLGDLPQGWYNVTSYHLDPDFDQSAQIEIYVTDTSGDDVLQEVTGNAGFDVGGVDSITTELMELTSATFMVKSNGLDDVLIRFNGTGSDTETPLNGLVIQRWVPEPHCWLLLALGALALLPPIIRRRRVARG